MPFPCSPCCIAAGFSPENFFNNKKIKLNNLIKIQNIKQTN